MEASVTDPVQLLRRLNGQHDQAEEHGPAIIRPMVSTLAELMQTEFPPTRWIIENIIPLGLTILVGAPKLGKSWLMLQTALAVAYGGVALGRIQVETASVLVLALEDTKRRLQGRAGILLGDDVPPAAFHFATEWPSLMDGGDAHLRQFLTDHRDVRLVIVDTFAKLRGHQAGNQNLYSGDYDAIGKLKRIADEFDIAMVVVHHTRKAGAEDPLDMVSGTQGLAGAADTILVLKKELGRADANLYVRGRDVPESDHALSFDPDSCTWTLMGDAETYRMSKERQAIVDLLRNSPEPLQPKQIAEALGKKDVATRVMLTRMAKEGTIDAMGGGLYRVPPTSHQRSLNEDDWESF